MEFLQNAVKNISQALKKYEYGFIVRDVLLVAIVLIVIFTIVVNANEIGCEDVNENADEVKCEFINMKEEFEHPTEIEAMAFEATAYCGCEKCCGKYASNRPVDENGQPIVYGASGKKLEEGISIAADWSVLPEGTVVEIEGYGTYIVDDKGGSVKGNTIDIYFENHDDALEFGRRTVNIMILGSTK